MSINIHRINKNKKLKEEHVDYPSSYLLAFTGLLSKELPSVTTVAWSCSKGAAYLHASASVAA